MPTPTLQRAASVHMKAEESPGTEFQENGLPARDFWGKGARVGSTYYTKNRATGKTIELPVTEDRVRKWMDAFQKFQTKEIPIPVCLDHDVKAETAVGRVIDLKRETLPDGDWIRPKYRVRGAKNIDIARQNQISMGLRPNYDDGTGETHAEAMWHLALTPIPVVPGQGLLVNASRDGEPDGEPEDVFLSLEPPTETNPPAADAPATIPQRSPTMTPEQRAAFVAATGAPADTADDALLSRVAEFASSAKEFASNAKSDFAKLMAWRGDAIEWKRQCDLELSHARAGLKEREIELSRGNDFGNPPAKEEPSDLLLSMAESSLVVAKENAVARGLHARTAEALFNMLHSDERPNDLALSMATGEVHPFGVRLFNLLSGASVAPPLGKVAGFDRPPVSGGGDNSQGATDPAVLAQISAQFSGPPKAV